MKLKATIALIAGSAIVLTACGSNDQDAQAICMNPQTQERVDDDFCEDDEMDYAGYPWVFFLPNTHIPSTGTRLAPGSYHNSPPKGYRANYNDFPAVGGTFTKPIPEAKSSKPTTKKPSSPAYKPPTLSKPTAKPAPKPAPKPSSRGK